MITKASRQIMVDKTVEKYAAQHWCLRLELRLEVEMSLVSEWGEVGV